MIRVLLFILAIAPTLATMAQPDSGQHSPGHITLHTPLAIDSLERVTRGKEDISGYRIQIYLGSASEARSARGKFLALGTGLTCNMVQNIPNYAVRVGDFRTELEAHKYLAQVKSQYPSAFVVQDKINPPRLSLPGP